MVVFSVVSGIGIWCAQAQERLPNEPLVLRPGHWMQFSETESKILTKASLWTSFLLEQEAMEGRLRLRASQSAPVGIHFLRGAAGDTVSPWQAVLLDELPRAVRNDRRNDALGRATDISHACVLTGTIQQSRSDFYRLGLAKGETVTIEVLAQRIFSKLDSNLRLLDEQGRQLAYCEDEPGLGKDSRLRYTAKTEQAIIIEVRDSFYGGSDQHVYALRVGDIPRINAAAKAGDGTLIWLGPDAGKTGGADKGAGIARWYAPRFGKGKPAAMVVMDAGMGDMMLEQEPNDQAAKANALEVSRTVFGRFEARRDADWFSWEAKKGEKFLVRAKTRSVGLPTDVRLTVQGGDGKTLASSKVAAEDEGGLDVTAAADGKLYLRVSHIAHLAGPEHGYRFVVQPGKTAVVAKTEADKLVLAPGGTADLKLTLDRLGYEGAMEFVVHPADTGLVMAKGNLEAKKKEGTIQLRASEGLKAGTLRQIQIQAAGPAGAQLQTYHSLTNQWGPSSTMAAVLDGWITVAIKEPPAAGKEGKSP